jgi:hypothetical protein
MAALPLLNNAESQTSGTTVTTGNSGADADSVAFDNVVIGANMTLTFDNAHAAHGSNAFKYALTSTATAITHLDWVFDAPVTRLYGALYVYITTGIVSSVRLIHFRNGAGTLDCGLFLDSSTNKVGIRSSADGAIATSATSLTLNAWNRIEFDYTFDAAAGAASVDLFAGANCDGVTPDSTVTTSAQNFGTQCDRVWIGCCTANFSSTSGAAYWLDDLNVNTTGKPGPGPYTLTPPQQIRPDADNAAGGWATTPLWSKVDEVTAGGDVISATASAGDPMAAPVIEGTAETAVSTAGTSHAITLPASIAATDLVLIIMDIGSTSATLNALAGWTEILDEASANGLKILWYTGAGVPGNPTFTSSASTRSASIAYRISGADKSITPQIGTTATGTSATPDPPASAAPPSSKDYLFIAFAGMAGEEANDDTWGNTSPTNYTPSPPLQVACGVAGTNLGGLILAASRQLTTGSAENPGTFGVDVSAAWRSQTITVHPLPTPATTGVAQLSLASGSTPATQTAHSLRVRPRVQSGAGKIRAALYESTNNRSGDLESSALTTSLADYTLAISDANAANITDYSNLEIRVWGYDASGGTPTFELDQVWLEIPAAAAGGTTYDELGSLVAGGLFSGADVGEHAEAGALTAAGLVSGADVREAAETGSLTSGVLAAGADVVTHAETAALIAGTFGSGADVYTSVEAGAITTGGLLSGVEQKIGGGETGSITAGGNLSGADVAQHSETGALTVGGLLSGADVHEANETGALIAGLLLSGADAATHAELGSLIAGALLAGADVAIHTETGSLTAGGLLSGIQAKEGAGKAGSITAGGALSGADASTHTETGSLVAGSVLAGADARVRAKTGSLLLSSLLSGTDAAIHTETGSLLNAGVISGSKAFQFSKTGSLLVFGYLAGSSAMTTEGILTIIFGPGSPSGGMGTGTPDAGELVGSPAGGASPGSPALNRYRPGSPGKG